MIKFALCALAILLCLAAPSRARAQEDADAVARQLSNPIANLTSVPLQTNFDFGGGAELMISRTILPISYHDYLPTPDDDAFGIGDITQSLFFSPRQSGRPGLTWGAGPAFLIPTASDDVLGAGKLGAGPTVIALQETGDWTIGALANHIWSFAGDDDRDAISTTFVQPFAAYHGFGHGRTVTLNTETSYDWEHDEWTVPLIASYSQVFAVGQQHMSAAIGGKYYVDGPDGAPQWGLRATLTFVFPTRH